MDIKEVSVPDYQTLYPYLFNRVTDAVTALQARDYGTAEDILKSAQQDTEAQYAEGEYELRAPPLHFAVSLVFSPAIVYNVRANQRKRGFCR